MIDQKKSLPASDNIKGLVQDVHELLEARMADLRTGTVLASVRASDAKIFITAARGQRTVSEIAGRLGVTKQAVSQGVKRLVDEGVVCLEPKPGNGKEKIVAMTEKGQAARLIAGEKLKLLETRLAEEIGPNDLEILRSLLRRIADLG